MWLRLWVAIGVTSSVFSQQTNTRIQHGSASFGWGWQLSQGDGPETIGHYYVKLPESEQRVVYGADSGGYHTARGAEVVNTSAHHTQPTNSLGDKASQLNAQQIQSQDYQHNNHNTTQPEQSNNQEQPVDIYLLQQQVPSAQPQLFQLIPNTLQYNNPPNYYNIKPIYNYRTQHPIQNQYNNEPRNENIDNSQPLQQEATENHKYSPTTIVQVFKNHNCTGDNLENTSKDIESDIKKSKELFAELPQYEIHNINRNFGAKDESRRPLTYRGAVHFRVETPRPHARNERYYYTTDYVPTTTETYNSTREGISKLVASTQDLISNEDLVKINHSVEKHLAEQSEDIIKPRSKYNYRSEGHDFRQGYPNQITVKAKIANIVKSDIDNLENNHIKEQVLQTSSNEYRFASPIIVADTPYDNYKSQIVNNLVSTMVPYIQNGYEIIGVRNSIDNSDPNNDNKETSGEYINVTPRPVGQKYLTPITVALRLLNDNDTEVFNTVDDHEASDSEFIPDTVQSPEKTRTIVEIQESIPVDITHINDVEVHEYLDEGRSNNNGPYDTAKSLYNKYVQAFESSKKIQQNMNDILHKYKALRDDNKRDNENDENNNESENEEDSKENLQQSENVQSEVEIRPNSDSVSNERSEYISYYNNYENQNRNIIQPIIIEKEVPITKFVDRYIERQVPYPETVEVQVPVDRPVPVAVPYEKIVEKPYEVTKYVDKPYPVEVPRPYPVEVKVPYPVEQKVYIDRPVHVPYPVEKIVEKQVLHHVPVPTPVGIPYEVQVPVEQKVLYPIAIDRPVPVPIEVEKRVPVDRIIHKEVPVPYPVEKRVPYPVHYETRVPVPYPVEKRVPVPVERIVEKPVTVTKIVEKPVHIEVPVPQPVPVAVHVPRPYPVDRIVEKKVPYPVPVDRIVEKKVPVQVPYPVEKIVEKIVEKPYVVTKYINKPYPVEKRVPYPVEKIVEKKVPYPVQVPVHIKVPYPVDRVVDRPVHIPVPVYHRYRQQQYEAEESKHYPQYQNLYKPDEKESAYSNQNQKSQAHELQAKAYAAQLKDKQNIQSTHWGNQYASSYQYINNTPEIKDDFKKSQSLSNYLEYLTNKQNSPYDYYGPVPMENQNDMWEKNRDYYDGLKVRRTDRTPKVTNLRIEYGGFKPPLIPSTEVDLDGMPVNKE